MPQTVDRVHEHWIEPIKGSRFRARVHPVRTVDDAMDLLDALRAEEPDATHHCWALRLRDGTARSSDDGEPSGSAGRPILARLEGGDDWIDVLVIVSRWYGGTKLGVGGLIRAYGGAASALLAEVPAVPWIATTELRITHAYGDSGAVDGVLTAHGVTPEDARYGADVTRTLVVPEAEADPLRRALVEATAGRIAVEP